MSRRGTMKTTRLRKVHCEPCDYIVRMTRSQIERGLPDCPCCHLAMTCADPADAIECGLLSLDELPRPLRTAICRANGWEDEIVRTSPKQDSKHWKYGGRRQPAEAMPF